MKPPRFAPENDALRRSRSSRWSAVLGLLALLASPATARAVQSAIAAAAVPANAGDDLREFAQQLTALRSGDEHAGSALKLQAERLCQLWRRCDAIDVARFYSALSREERLDGWRAESELAELRASVHDAGVAGLRGEAWSLERERLIAALDALSERQARRPDFTPAAGALSLAALLETEHAEHSERSDSNEDDTPTRVARAQVRAQAALALLERAGQRTPRLEPLWLLGRLATLLGDHEQARVHLWACATLARSVQRDDFRERALEGCIAIARLEGDVRTQEALLAELASFRSPAESWSVARDWGARLLSDDFALEAAEFLERFAPGEHAHVADRDEWDLLLGSARLRAGDNAAAREHFERVARTSGGELAVLALASLALHEAREFEALELLGAPERLALFSPLGRARADALLGEAYARTNQLDLAREHLERACRAALEWERRARGTATLEAPFPRAAGSVIGERLGLHTVALLADVLARGGEGLEAVRVCEDWQSRTLRGGGGLDTRALLEWAGAFELGLVTWVVGANFTFVAHVAPDGSVSHARVPRGRRAIDDAVRRLRELALTSERRSGALATSGAALSRWSEQARAFLAELAPTPIAAALAKCAKHAGPAPRLLLALHGPLEAAPLEALGWEELCEAPDLALATLSGIPSPSVGERLGADALTHWNLLGGPLDLAQHEPLPGAREELAVALETHPGATLAHGAAFDRAALLSALDSQDPLHLATHLVLRASDEQDKSANLSTRLGFSVSAGEFVTLADVERAEPNMPLAVLSACWTGGGESVDAEGLFGMARAFLASGSRNVVVTLWPVEDAAAAEFGAAFHRALKAQGAQPSPARACASARRELERGGFERSGWAAFRLLGRD